MTDSADPESTEGTVGPARRDPAVPEPDNAGESLAAEDLGASTGVDPSDTFEDVTIRRSAVAASARWSLIGLVAKQFARIGFSVLLARLLGPTNFGIVGQATIYLSFTLVFLDIGLASALIQRKRIDDATIGTATVLNAGAVIVLILLTQAVAGVWASVFRTPELEMLLRVLSLDFLLIGAAVVPTALLTRRLNFRLLAAAEIAGTFIGGAAGIAAAVMGAQYWALLVQTLATDFVYAAVVTAAVGRPILSWSKAAYRSIVGFSVRVFGSEVMRFLSQNADKTLIALRLGPTALANYSLSFRVLLLPVQILSQTANRLVFPIFSRLNDQPERQATHFLRVTTSLSLVVTPPMLLVALDAPRGVPIVFGPEWHAAVRPMQILAVVSIVSAVMGTGGSVMLAKGRADWALRWAVVTTGSLIAGFLVGLQWGVDGVAWAYLLIGVPLAMVEIGFIRKLIPYTATQYLQAIAPAGVGGVVLTVVWFATMAVMGGGNDVVALVVASLVAGLAYCGLIRLCWPAVLREQLDFAKLMISRGAGGES